MQTVSQVPVRVLETLRFAGPDTMGNITSTAEILRATFEREVVPSLNGGYIQLGLVVLGLFVTWRLANITYYALTGVVDVAVIILIAHILLRATLEPSVIAILPESVALRLREDNAFVICAGVVAMAYGIGNAREWFRLRVNPRGPV